jgi:hypothetical protein
LDPITLRSIERIVAVAIGGIAIYLGYRLFLAIPERTESQGRVLLPGGISIFITRIGPGAFFALFGAIVVAISFHQAIKYNENFSPVTQHKEFLRTGPKSEQVQSDSSAGSSRSYTGFGSSEVVEDLQTARYQAQNDIKLLNTTLPLLLRKDLNPQTRTDMELMIPRLKLALIRATWGPDWGDFPKFKEWVENGATEPAPKELSKPSALYLHGVL